MASHVFFISVYAGDLIGFVGECKECGVKREVDAIRYQAIEKKLPPDLEQLVQNTFPNIQAAYANGGPVSEGGRMQAAREQALMEPFKYLGPMVEERFGEKSGRFDPESGLGCLTTILLVVLCFFVTVAMEMSGLRQFLIYSMLTLIPILTVYTIVQMCLVSRRFVARRILPPLAAALRPLNPTRDELSACLTKLKNLNAKIGSKVDPDSLWAEINEIPQG
jgi:hypothetical protein